MAVGANGECTPSRAISQLLSATADSQHTVWWL